MTPCSVITPLGAKRANTSATDSASSPSTVSETSSQFMFHLFVDLFDQFNVQRADIGQVFQPKITKLRYLVAGLESRLPRCGRYNANRRSGVPCFDKQQLLDPDLPARPRLWTSRIAPCSGSLGHIRGFPGKTPHGWIR
ncbi:MAG: hypothetical protein MZV64_19210 [Ignavibacteriales bacterium]|nr:hypothetical protein [Ignavibacteriales bacterium]